MNSQIHIGKIILAGAGPGDPDLITVKAVRAIQRADVILADRLVSWELIRRYAGASAVVIEVGKQCRRGVSTSQDTINRLMIEYAQQGKIVVRLKGGDISFFSNVLDELNVIVANRIPYEIIPGITAASGAAAFAGIPLTAREYSTGVRFLTYYKSSVISDDHWKELAHTDDTLVFYMSAETIDGLAGKLLEHGVDGSKKIAVIEQATTEYQQVYTSALSEYWTILGGKTLLSPSLIMVGKVVNLHGMFNWFETGPNTDREYYFKPLTAAVEPINTEENKLYADRA